MNDTNETPKQYQCRHIFTDGRRCASPCLRGEEFCYYHHTTRKPAENPRQRRSRRSTFHLPLPEDRSAIQASIGEVLQRIAANHIDPRRAGLLLYGLQIASLNLPKPQPATKSTSQRRTANQSPDQTTDQTVEEITIDPTLGILAPRAEVGKAEKRKSPVELLIESMLQSKKEEEPTTIPTIQATATDLPVSVPRSCRHPERREGSRRSRSRHQRSPSFSPLSQSQIQPSNPPPHPHRSQLNTVSP
jgi:hypothetical protein